MSEELENQKPSTGKPDTVRIDDDKEFEEEGFAELVRFTLPGFLGGLALGALFDYWGLQLSAVGQWLVRTLAGEGESLLEGLFALRRRLARRAGSLVEAYGWGKLAGMILPWLIDWISRAWGLDVYAVEGFYIPYFYALSDQVGANVSGLIYFKRKEKSVPAALAAYFHNPVMITSLAVIFLVPLGLLAARLLGFSPVSQKLTALETIAANLCWLPPVIGWIVERKNRSRPDR